MKSSAAPPVREGIWISLWVVALISFLAHLGLCQFYSFGDKVPLSLDVNPSNLWKLAYHFPPTGTFQVLNWLGVAYLPQPLNPFSLAAAHLPIWWFFTFYVPFVATLALLAMAAFLRELDLPRPAALFGGVIFAWQGDIVPFVMPGHYAYMTAWPFFAIAAWGALRAQRTGRWAYAMISGASCGIMVALPSNTDRGAIASLLVAALYLAPTVRRILAKQPLFARSPDWQNLRHLALCAATALCISIAAFLTLFQSNIVGVKLGGFTDREQTYKLVTQFSLGPAETLTYLVPGFFGWHINSTEGPYWGYIGETLDFPAPESSRNLNLAISTTGTVATILACIGAGVLLPGAIFGPGGISDRQRLYGRALLAVGGLALVLSWGWHTPLYRPLFALPLMDKWRNPLKWLEMTNFALVVLSAYGVQHLMISLSTDRERNEVVRYRFAWFSNAVLIALLFGLLASYPMALVLASALQAEHYEVSAIANIMSTLHVSLLVALAVAALFSFFIRALWLPERWQKLTLPNPLLHRFWQATFQPRYLPVTMAVLLSALSMTQLAWVTSKFIFPTDLKTLTESNPLLEELRSEGPEVRVKVDVSDPMLNVLLQNQFASDNISCLDISAASRIPDDLSTFFSTLANDQARLWFLSGVKNVVLPQPVLEQMRRDPGIAANIDHADGYMLEPTESPNVPSHALVALRAFLNKATLVSHVEVFASDDDLLKRLAASDWNPRESVLLTQLPHEKPEDNLSDVAGPGAMSVYLETYTPTQIAVKTRTDGPGYYLLINDQFDPDWHVQINGRDAELLRADYIMRAVALPAGSAIVTMDYVAHYHVAGLDLPVEAVNDFSDGSMLAAWLIAGFALLPRRWPGWWRPRAVSAKRNFSKAL